MLLVESSSTNVLTNSIFSKSEYFEISFKLASPAKVENGAKSPNDAGATSSFWKSLINSSHEILSTG